MTGHLTAAVLTVSDGVSAGTREDRSGQALADLLATRDFDVIRRAVVPDDVGAITEALRSLAGEARLVVTTGGTGFGPRDVTPEATRQVIEREAPGLAEAMRARGRASTPMADLSRGLVGSAGRALVVNLPGSARGAVESLEAILEVVPHALDLLAGHTEHGHADAATGPGSGDGTAATEAGTGDVLDELARRRAAGEEVVLATAVRTEGEPPCVPGQRLLLARTGPMAGTLGCAEFDAAATDDAPGVLDGGRPVLRTYEHDLGTVEVQLEPHLRRATLLVLGATPVARWLLAWGRDLGYRTVLVEPRPERVTSDHRAAADDVRTSLAGLDLGDTVDAVHTDHDAPDVSDALVALLRGGARFVGLMGSRRHASSHLETVRAALGDEAADRIDTPVGLDLGGRSPQEIALSILAGVVAARYGRGGGRIAR